MVDHQNLAKGFSGCLREGNLTSRNVLARSAYNESEKPLDKLTGDEMEKNKSTFTSNILPMWRYSNEVSDVALKRIELADIQPKVFSKLQQYYSTGISWKSGRSKNTAFEYRHWHDIQSHRTPLRSKMWLDRIQRMRGQKCCIPKSECTHMRSKMLHPEKYRYPYEVKDVCILRSETSHVRLYNV